MDRGAWWAPWGHKESDMTEQLTHMRARAHTHTCICTSMSWGYFLPSLGLQTHFLNMIFSLQERDSRPS